MSTKRSASSRLGVLLAGALTLTGASEAGAYLNYSASKSPVPTGNCVTCHGDFRASPYLRLGADRGWGTSLMTGHINAVDDCFSCHSGGFYPVPTFLSSGTFRMGCLGCHGRFEAGLSSTEASGLRQRHWNAGITVCGGCHPLDSNPGTFVPVGEDVLPPNYNLDLAVISLIDPCNPGGSGEHFAGAGAGLDNDGDGLFDMIDPDCITPAPTETQIRTTSLVLTDDTTPPVRASRRRIRFTSNTWRDSPSNRIVPPARGSANDPRTSGGTVTVANTNGIPESVRVFLPASGWSAVGTDSSPRGFAYRSSDPGAPITRVRIREHGIVIRGGGSDWGYGLDRDAQGSVSVALSLGSRTWCADTAGQDPRRDRRDLFVARRVAAPESCPFLGET